MNDLFEKGKITELQFIETFQKYIPNADVHDIRKAWNAVIGEFPVVSVGVFADALAQIPFVFVDQHRFDPSAVLSTRWASLSLATFTNVLKRCIIHTRWA
jgi:hypothetical protein